MEAFDPKDWELEEDPQFNEDYTLQGWIVKNTIFDDTVLFGEFDITENLYIDKTGKSRGSMYEIYLVDQSYFDRPVATFNPDMAKYYRRYGALLTCRRVYKALKLTNDIHVIAAMSSYLNGLMKAFNIYQSELEKGD